MDNEQTIIFDIPDSEIKVSRTIVKTTPSRSRRKLFKREARRLFTKRGNTLKLMYASLLCVMLTVGVKTITAGFFSIFNDGFEYACSFASDIIYVALLVPAVYAVYGLAVTGSVNYNFGFRVYSVFYVYFWRYALLILTLCGGLHSLKLAFNFIGGRWEYNTALICTGMLAGAFIAVLTVITVMIQRVYLTLHLSVIYPDMTIRDAVCNSRVIMRGYKAEALTLTVSFTGWLILSFLTVGVVLVVYAMPYFMLANSAFAGYLSDINAEPIENGTYTEVKKRVSRRQRKFINKNSRRLKYGQG